MPSTTHSTALARGSALWAFLITALGLFMVSLDNLVVTTALPVIREDLHASLSDLEWTVNAYTLTFAVLLLTGAALGDRFGRRRMFAIGLLGFTVASAAAALAPGVGTLVAARAVQGAMGALILPLSLTLLSAAVSPERRGVALGAWGGVGGLAVAFGPVVGGAIVNGISWQWIFWLNVPIGLLLAPLALTFLRESRGSDSALDLPGVALVSGGLFGIVWGLVRGNAQGWGSAQIVGSLAAGVALLGAFLVWERIAARPMLPLHLFRSRTFSAINTVSLLMYFGMFGSIFLLAQYFQVVQGYSALQSGIRILPWTIMPMFIAPVAGALSGRIHAGRMIALGMLAQAAGLAWIATATSVTMPYHDVVGGFVLSGFGMALYFAPTANVVLGAVRRDMEGIASGTNNAVREVGGVLGVAVLASVFGHHGGYETPQRYVDGLTWATYVGAGVVALGAVAALLIPSPRRAAAAIPSQLSDPLDAELPVVAELTAV